MADNSVTPQAAACPRCDPILVACHRAFMGGSAFVQREARRLLKGYIDSTSPTPSADYPSPESQMPLAVCESDLAVLLVGLNTLEAEMKKRITDDQLYVNNVRKLMDQLRSGQRSQ